jgi:hypothetical protein
VTDTNKDNPLVRFVRAMARRQAKIDVREVMDKQRAAVAKRLRVEATQTEPDYQAFEDPDIYLGDEK